MNKLTSVGILTMAMILNLGGMAFSQEDPEVLILKQLCEENNSIACFKMGERSRVIDRDNKAAEKYFTKSCEGGHITACTHAGILLQARGKQYSPEWKKAVKFFEKGCNEKEVRSDRACFNLGSLKYREGRASKAKKYYKLACDNGNEFGCRNLKNLNR